MAFRNIFIGLGPAVYLLMIRGRIICMGTIGTANNARVSFGIPASISFRPDRESAAAKAICGMNDKTISYEHLLFAYLKTKGEDELQGNHASDQHLFFRYIDSTVPLLLKSRFKASNMSL